MDSDNDLDDFLADVESSFALSTSSEVLKRIKGRIAAEEAPEDFKDQQNLSAKTSNHGLRRTRKKIKDMTRFLGDVIPKQRIEIEANFDLRSLLTPSKYACSPSNSTDNDTFNREHNQNTRKRKKGSDRHSGGPPLSSLEDIVLHSLQAWSSNHKYYTYPSRSQSNLNAISAPPTSLSRVASSSRSSGGGGQQGGHSLTTANIRKVLNVNTLWSPNTKALDDHDTFIAFKKYRLLWLEALHHCWDQVLDNTMNCFYLIGQTDTVGVNYDKNTSSNAASLAGMVCATDYVQDWIKERADSSSNDKLRRGAASILNPNPQLGMDGDDVQGTAPLSLLILGVSKQLLSRLTARQVEYSIVSSANNPSESNRNENNSNKHNSRYNPVSAFERREGHLDGHTIVVTSNINVLLALDVLCEVMFSFADHDGVQIGSKSTLELPRIVSQSPFLHGIETYMAVSSENDAVQCKELVSAGSPGMKISENVLKKDNEDGNTEVTRRGMASKENEGNIRTNMDRNNRVDVRKGINATASTHRIKLVGDLFPNSIAYLTSTLVALARLAERKEMERYNPGSDYGNSVEYKECNQQQRRAVTPVVVPSQGRDAILYSIASKYNHSKTSLITSNDNRGSTGGNNTSKKEAVTAVAPFSLQTTTRNRRKKEMDTIEESKTAQRRKQNLLQEMSKDLPSRVDTLVKLQNQMYEKKKDVFKGNFGGLESEPATAFLNSKEHIEAEEEEEEDDDDDDEDSDDTDGADSDDDSEELDMTRGYKAFSIRIVSSARLDKFACLPDQWIKSFDEDNGTIRRTGNRKGVHRKVQEIFYYTLPRSNHGYRGKMNYADQKKVEDEKIYVTYEEANSSMFSPSSVMKSH